MPIRIQTESEIVVESPHGRIGPIQRPLVTLRQGLDHVLVEDARNKTGESIRLPLERIEGLRLVPSVKPSWHGWQRGGDRWALTLRFKSGEDLLLEQGLDSAAALTLARAVRGLSGLALDEASTRMFGLADAVEPAEDQL